MFKNIIKSIAILAGATALGMVFYRIGFSSANIIMVYILGVLITSIATSHRVYSLISSIASVFLFNYLFTAPRFSLSAYETGYPVTFVVMFITAYVSGTFSLRYKEQARQSEKLADTTRILFDTDKLLTAAKGRDAIIKAAAGQISRLLERNIVIYLNVDGKLSEPYMLNVSDSSCAGNAGVMDEKNVAEWVLANNQYAGASTDRFADSVYVYYAVRVNDRVYGVIGIEAKDKILDSSSQSILLSILGECALALENEKNQRDKEEAAILAESEQLRANLLRSISHDLRTPLTTIAGNASSLLSNGKSFDEQTRYQIYQDIYNDSVWLNNLVENLLYATRIEEGRMVLNTSTELLADVIDDAVRHVKQHSGEHSIFVESDDEYILVTADARLIVQVIINIVDNAVRYTPPGSHITIRSCRENNMAVVYIEDNGNGISDEDKEHVFDKFYSGTNRIADNRRSIGLGLYLCKAIIEAHGGTITVRDNNPAGAVFVFTLPLADNAF